ncbi:MAG: glycosyltransferase, partial [Burkholderiaceae bacterium]
MNKPTAASPDSDLSVTAVAQRDRWPVTAQGAPPTDGAPPPPTAGTGDTGRRPRGTVEAVPKPRRHRRTVDGWRMVVAAVATAFAIGMGNLFTWEALHPPITAPDVDGPIGGLAYNAYGRWDSPLINRRPPDESIARDIAVLSEMTSRIRTYTSSEFPSIPAHAEAQRLLITAGVWLDRREGNVENEIRALETAVREHSNVERVIVGNETILHGSWTVPEIIAKMHEVKRRVRKPVSTAEPWHVWLRHPELVRAADFITVHLLPYWEGLPPGAALDYAFERLDQIQKRYPGKKIVIGEIGWPSQGDRRFAAHATPANQALFIREFVARAQSMDLDYFLMESVDQPWKIDNEGRAGPYWGLLDAERQPKFAMTGPIESDPGWRTKAAAASALGALLAFAFLVRFPRMRRASRLVFAVALQAVAAVAVWLVALPFDRYLQWVDWLFVALLVPAVTMTALIFLVNAFEFVEVFWRGNLRRGHGVRPLASGRPEPMVSVHLACCNEPPEMVIATIRSLQALDYRNFEVLVVDNNTRDPRLWEPVRDYVAGLDPRFRFFHLPSWPGYKAGALNFALEQTDPRAEVVGVVDADYQVVTGWLRDMVGHFDDAQVAVVQAPQAHRGWSRHRFRQMMNFEYDGFFRIGMHHRNERNAIIQHGTMTLVRASALRA